MTEQRSPIVGIDLGTTNSVVAFVIDGQPRVLEEAAEKLLPSVVGINPQGQLITGTVAKNQLAAFPDHTIASIKRRMGQMDPVTLGDQSFTPPEISAMILRRLRDRASRELNCSVNRAVITVPAFFDENQRQATREAAELAGLTVERIINEPTAATLVYHAGSHDRKQIAVYDFGGGTFDVSIVRMEAGVTEVLSSRGDVYLGGDDLDQALMDHVSKKFRTDHKIDLQQDASTRHRLWQACEQAKRQLSTEETVQITEEFIAEKNGKPLNLAITITRGEFEEMIEPFVERTIERLDEALREASLTVHQLDDLVLVGGSTRIPMVERRLREEFQREPSRAVDPDLAVALGAAVQAAMIEGESVGPVLVDVASHTLGIESVIEMTWSGPQTGFSPIIRRNTPLPARYEEAFFKMYEDQEVAEIHVLQGEHDEVHRNLSIGKFKLDLKQGGGDLKKIVVRFELTLDGTLKVTATQAATGSSEELTINNALSRFQAEERARVGDRLEAMFKESDEFEDGDNNQGYAHQWSPETATSDNENPAASDSRFPEADELLKQAQDVKTNLASEDAEELETLCKALKQAIEANDSTAVTNISAELEDLLFYVR